MIVNTTRFGAVEVDETRVIEFSRGLLGFPQHHRYALLQPQEESCFFWLQSMDSPELAFVVTDPMLFVGEYQVPLKAEQAGELGLADPAEAQVLVIVNKRGTVLTGNLQGPLVIHPTRRCGEQLVLSGGRFNTRVPLLDLAGPVSASA